MSKMSKNIIILDGYNVIHKIPDLARLLEKDLATARDGLFRFCSSWLSTRNDVWLFYIVFDGQSSIVDSTYQPARGIRPVFTKTGEQADTRILEIIKERKNDCRITVVSDDNFVKNHSRGLDVAIMSVSDFFSIPTAKRSKKTNKHTCDKQLTPKQINDINQSLKDEWNIE